MLEIIFYTCVIFVLTSYLFYPIIMLFVMALHQSLADVRYVLKGDRKDRRKREVGDSELPSVAVIIAAYNEETCIKERIENLLELDYPKDRIRFYVGNDGSQDSTSAIVSSFSDERLCFVDFENNRGKASVLNDLVEISTEDILVFSDANTNFRSDSIRALVRHFLSDDSVGAVCGELHLVSGETAENLDGIYWKYEQVLKLMESRVGGLLGANGAIYAIRSSCYQSIPRDTVVDDFTIVFDISLSGSKAVYDPEAVAVEEVPASIVDEYGRRVRIGVGNYQVFFRSLKALSPQYGNLWFCYICHKVMRWFTPHALLLALICSTALSTQSFFFLLITVVQISVYYLSYKKTSSPPSNKLLRLVVFWVSMNIALGHGFIKYCKGNVGGSWKSTSR